MLQYFDVEVIDSVVYRALDNKWVSNSLHLLIISKRESYNQRYLVNNFRLRAHKFSLSTPGSRWQKEQNFFRVKA